MIQIFHMVVLLGPNVYVSKGCPKIKGTQLFQVARDSTYSVRCCSKKDDKCTSVNCPNKVNYQEALDICQSRGERLCFQDELTKRCCSSGCEYDGEWIWVADKVPSMFEIFLYLFLFK